MAPEFGPLKRSEICQAAELATRAFDDYEFFTNWFPDKEERNRVQLSIITHEYKANYSRAHHLAARMDGNEKFNILKNSDVHSHARLRINGVVMNTDLWYELYDVNRNNYLYLPEERRSYIW